MGNVHQLPDDDSRCAGKDVKYLSLSIRARSRLATKVYLTLRMQMRSRNFSRMTTWSGFVQAASAFMFRAIWVHREAGCAPCFTRKSSKWKNQSLFPSTPTAVGACENPCKSIPFAAETQSEKEAIASWQGVMRAMANNDADAYASLIADEFTATDTHRDRPYTKSDRLAQIRKQKLALARSVPPELTSPRRFDFGETVMMIAREQRPGARSYFNTRMFVKRGSRWQMLFSFNTRIE